MTEDEMVGWHHQYNGHEFEQAPGDGEGQGSLASCSPWGCKESDTTQRLNNHHHHCQRQVNSRVSCSERDPTIQRPACSLRWTTHFREIHGQVSMMPGGSMALWDQSCPPGGRPEGHTVTRASAKHLQTVPSRPLTTAALPCPRSARVSTTGSVSIGRVFHTTGIWRGGYRAMGYGTHLPAVCPIHRS